MTPHEALAGARLDFSEEPRWRTLSDELAGGSSTMQRLAES